MLRVIKQLFAVLTPAQRKSYYFLQFLVILMAIMEIVGVASIVPFMALVGDMDQLNQDSIFGKAYIASGINTEFKFVLMLGISVLMLLIIASTVSIFTIWRLTKFAHKTGAELGDRLYSYYLKKDWLFHASGNSSNLIKKIATEIPRTTQGIIVQLMQMNAKIVLAIFVIITVFFYDPKVALSGFLVFSLSYILLFSIVKIRLQNNGKILLGPIAQFVRDLSVNVPLLYGMFSIVLALGLGIGAAIVRRFLSKFKAKFIHTPPPASLK